MVLCVSYVSFAIFCVWLVLVMVVVVCAVLVMLYMDLFSVDSSVFVGGDFNWCLWLCNDLFVGGVFLWGSKLPLFFKVALR